MYNGVRSPWGLLFGRTFQLGLVGMNFFMGACSQYCGWPLSTGRVPMSIDLLFFIQGTSGLHTVRIWQLHIRSTLSVESGTETHIIIYCNWFQVSMLLFNSEEFSQVRFISTFISFVCPYLFSLYLLHFLIKFQQFSAIAFQSNVLVLVFVFVTAVLH